MHKSVILTVIAAIILVMAIGIAGYWSVTSPPPVIPTASPTPLVSSSPVVSSTPVPSSSDMIHLTTPQANQTVSSPLSITGEARGSWYFEASFPVHLEDATGKTIASTTATAQGDWMTPNFVPFKATLTVPTTFSGTAILVLAKDNSSGLPTQADSLRIPVTVMANSATTSAVSVFFTNNRLVTAGQDDCTTVFPVTRIVPKTTAVARAALEQLITGPTPTEQAQGYTTSINTGVKIQKLTITNGVATVDFNQQLQQAVGGSCRVTAIRQQITSTLQQFPTVRQVIISINGRTADILQP